MALSLAASNEYSGTATTHAVNLPASISAGDLLLMFFAMNGSSATITDPSGFTQIGGNVNTDTYRIYAKIADGSEGATVNVGLSSSQNATAITYRITGNRNGVTTSEIAVSTVVDASTATPDPPNLTPSWGSAENLWIALTFSQDGTYTFSSYPTNYSLGQRNVQIGAGSGSGQSAAARLLTASSEDPGTFTTVTSRNRSTYTLAIRPAVTAYTIAADAGSYAVTGQTAALKHAFKAAAGAGAYSISGQTAALKHGWKVAAGIGGYSLTGADATLIKGSSSAKVLSADAGSYAFTGQTAGLLHAWRNTAGAGGYSLTGQDAALRYGRKVAAQAGSYAISGATANFVRTRRVTAAAGSYTLTGTAATLKRTYRLSAATGSYNLVGAAVSLISIVPADPIATLLVKGPATLRIDTPRPVLMINSAGSSPLKVRASQFGPLKVASGVRELITA